MKLVVLKTFKFAHGGVIVIEYQKGQKFETEDQALIDVALEEKWAKKQGVAQDESTDAAKVADVAADTTPKNEA